MHFIDKTPVCSHFLSNTGPANPIITNTDGTHLPCDVAAETSSHSLCCLLQYSIIKINAGAPFYTENSISFIYYHWVNTHTWFFVVVFSFLFPNPQQMMYFLCKHTSIPNLFLESLPLSCVPLVGMSPLCFLFTLFFNLVQKYAHFDLQTHHCYNADLGWVEIGFYHLYKRHRKYYKNCTSIPILL